MPKVPVNSSISVEQLAQAFGKSVEYTNAMLVKHSVTITSWLRTVNDGLDAFYSDMTSYHNTDSTLTKQEFAVECDPNEVVSRALRGMDVSTKAAFYGDFANMPASYHEALNIVTSANQSFAQLDAQTRAKFNNDPGAFIEALNNSDNYEEMLALGLVNPKQQTSSPATETGSAAVKEGGGEGA